jgi:hypothetical protein
MVTQKRGRTGTLYAARISPEPGSLGADGGGALFEPDDAFFMAFELKFDSVEALYDLVETPIHLCEPAIHIVP